MDKSKSELKEIENIKKYNLPKITINDVLDLAKDLNEKSIEDLLKEPAIIDENLLSINEMEDKIGEHGDNAVWQGIERVSNLKDRLAYRQLFFLAGGDLEPKDIHNGCQGDNRE